ncbi:MAG: extracellular solute-binding protein [Arachnia sp.]
MTNPLEKATLGRRMFLTGTAAVAVAGLAACGDGKGPTPNNTGGGGVGTADYVPGTAKLKVELGPEIEGVLYPDGYIGPKARTIEKFGDGTTEFRVVTRSFPEQNTDTDNLYSKHLEEVTGVKVKYEIVPAGDDGTPKVNAMLSSGDLPDVFMLGAGWMGGFTRSQLYAYGSQGLLMALDELVDTYAPELQATFAAFPDFRKYLTAPDGKLYTFPGINQCYHCASWNQRAWIHTPSLQQTGISMDSVKTIDDFENLLKELKAAGISPLTGYVDVPPLGLLQAAHLDIGINFLRLTNGEITFTAIEDGNREALKVANRWLKDGLIDKNAFSMNDEQYKRAGMAAGKPTAAIFSGGSPGYFVEVKPEDPASRYNEFQAVPPFTGPSGKAWVAWDHTPGGVPVMALTKDCKNPEQMIRWADYQLSLMGTLHARLGARFGETWEWAKEGEKGIDARQAIYKRIPGVETKQNEGWPEQNPHNLVMDVRHGEMTDPKKSMEPLLYNAGKLMEVYATPVEDYFTEPFFSIEQSAQIGELRVNIDNAIKQGQSSLALGTTDPNKDSDWEAFVNSIKGAGLDTYLGILKEATANSAK